VLVLKDQQALGKDIKQNPESRQANHLMAFLNLSVIFES
jgi:hypothetical protein